MKPSATRPKKPNPLLDRIIVLTGITDVQLQIDRYHQEMGTAAIRSSTQRLLEKYDIIEKQLTTLEKRYFLDSYSLLSKDEQWLKNTLAERKKEPWVIETFQEKKYLCEMHFYEHYQTIMFAQQTLRICYLLRLLCNDAMEKERYTILIRTLNKYIFNAMFAYRSTFEILMHKMGPFNFEQSDLRRLSGLSYPSDPNALMQEFNDQITLTGYISTITEAKIYLADTSGVVNPYQAGVELTLCAAVYSILFAHSLDAYGRFPVFSITQVKGKSTVEAEITAHASLDSSHMVQTKKIFLQLLDSTFNELRSIAIKDVSTGEKVVVAKESPRLIFILKKILTNFEQYERYSPQLAYFLMRYAHDIIQHMTTIYRYHPDYLELATLLLTLCEKKYQQHLQNKICPTAVVDIDSRDMTLVWSIVPSTGQMVPSSIEQLTHEKKKLLIEKAYNNLSAILPGNPTMDNIVETYVSAPNTLRSLYTEVTRQHLDFTPENIVKIIQCEFFSLFRNIDQFEFPEQEILKKLDDWLDHLNFELLSLYELALEFYKHYREKEYSLALRKLQQLNNQALNDKKVPAEMFVLLADLKKIIYGKNRHSRLEQSHAQTVNDHQEPKSKKRNKKKRRGFIQATQDASSISANQAVTATDEEPITVFKQYIDQLEHLTAMLPQQTTELLQLLAQIKQAGTCPNDTLSLSLSGQLIRAYMNLAMNYRWNKNYLSFDTYINYAVQESNRVIEKLKHSEIPADIQSILCELKTNLISFARSLNIISEKQKGEHLGGIIINLSKRYKPTLLSLIQTTNDCIIFLKKLTAKIKEAPPVKLTVTQYEEAGYLCFQAELYTSALDFFKHAEKLSLRKIGKTAKPNEKAVNIKLFIIECYLQQARQLQKKRFKVLIDKIENQKKILQIYQTAQSMCIETITSIYPGYFVENSIGDEAFSHLPETDKNHINSLGTILSCIEGEYTKCYNRLASKISLKAADAPNSPEKSSDPASLVKKKPSASQFFPASTVQSMPSDIPTIKPELAENVDKEIMYFKETVEKVATLVSTRESSHQLRPDVLPALPPEKTPSIESDAPQTMSQEEQALASSSSEPSSANSLEALLLEDELAYMLKTNCEDDDTPRIRLLNKIYAQIKIYADKDDSFTCVTLYYKVIHIYLKDICELQQSAIVNQNIEKVRKLSEEARLASIAGYGLAKRATSKIFKTSESIFNLEEGPKLLALYSYGLCFLQMEKLCQKFFPRELACQQYARRDFHEFQQ